MAKQLERLVSKKELSEETGLTISLIESAMVRYDLPYYKIGRNVKFKVSEVSKWIEQRKKAS